MPIGDVISLKDALERLKEIGYKVRHHEARENSREFFVIENGKTSVNLHPDEIEWCELNQNTVEIWGRKGDSLFRVCCSCGGYVDVSL
ncbi:MAG: hypothetical protein E3J35_00660 [Methanomassiliicoccales archaeon]|nr:MAG: hypothetical protein E3J35_00660 [Methanomassiliicoccales archaeon]